MQAGVLYRIPGHNFTELTCIPSLVCVGDSSKYFAGKALALTANTQKSFWKQVILFYSKDAMTYPSPPAPPQSWVVSSTLGNTWKSQLSTYIGCPGSVRTSSHLDSSACVTRCPGHHGHPRTCQDTYQDILEVCNSPGHSGCPELSTKSWLLWSSWTCTMYYAAVQATTQYSELHLHSNIADFHGNCVLQMGKVLA